MKNVKVHLYLSSIREGGAHHEHLITLEGLPSLPKMYDSLRVGQQSYSVETSTSEYDAVTRRLVAVHVTVVRGVAQKRPSWWV